MSDRKEKYTQDRYCEPIGTPPEVYYSEKNCKNDIDHGNVRGKKRIYEKKTEYDTDNSYEQHREDDQYDYTDSLPIKQKLQNANNAGPNVDFNESKQILNIDQHYQHNTLPSANYTHDPNYNPEHYTNRSANDFYKNGHPDNINKDLIYDYTNDANRPNYINGQSQVPYTEGYIDPTQYTDQTVYNLRPYNEQTFNQYDFPYKPDQYNTNEPYYNIQPYNGENVNYEYNRFFDGRSEQPLYVNVKQFHCIRKRKLRRDFLDTLMRQSNSAGYLHESRHRHAMNRMRAPSGRFLTKKETAERKEKLQAEGEDPSKTT